MEDITRTLSRLVGELDAEGKPMLALSLLKGRWSQIAGEELAAVCSPCRIEAGTLVAAVEGQEMAEALGPVAARLAAKCNRFLADDVVSRVRFESRPVRPRGRQAQAAPSGDALPHELGSHIKDPAVREAFRRACARCLGPEGRARKT